MKHPLFIAAILICISCTSQEETLWTGAPNDYDHEGAVKHLGKRGSC